MRWGPSRTSTRSHTHWVTVLQKPPSTPCLSLFFQSRHLYIFWRIKSHKWFLNHLIMTSAALTLTLNPPPIQPKVVWSSYDEHSAEMHTEVYSCDEPRTEPILIHENFRPSSSPSQCNMKKSISLCCLQCTPIYLMFKKEQRTGSSSSITELTSVTVSQYLSLSPASI